MISIETEDAAVNGPDGKTFFFPDYHLLVDGAIIKDSAAEVSRLRVRNAKLALSENQEFFYVLILEYDVIEQFFKKKISEIPKEVSVLGFSYVREFEKGDMDFSIRDNILMPNGINPDNYFAESQYDFFYTKDKVEEIVNEVPDIITVNCILSPDTDNWVQPWSISQYSDTFVSIALDNDRLTCRVLGYPTRIQCAFSIDVNVDKAISDLIEGLHEEVGGVHNDAVEKLYLNMPRQVSVLFNFPEDVKVPCEQYLVYFAQFLKDLGVEATADLKHGAKDVLFTVTPDDPREALDKIREALNVYLELPTMPASAFASSATDSLEVQRLNATLLNTQSQLMFANMAIQMKTAEVESKNATIQAKEATIQQLSGNVILPVPIPITGDVFIKSLIDTDRVLVDESKSIESGPPVSREVVVVNRTGASLTEIIRRGRLLLSKKEQ